MSYNMGLVSRIFLVVSILSAHFLHDTESKQIQLTEKAAVDAAYDLLKQGEEQVKLNEHYRDVTLVVGNTGAGKTTFIQWIAGDNDKLISKEVGKDTGKFIIDDGNRIANSTLTSKTLFPELVIDQTTNAAFYDCPGFSDTRNMSYDIAATYFTKKVADHANKVKIILVVSYHSVTKGADRHSFRNALRHITDLIQSVKKFESSIALVVTKVDNDLIKRGKNYSLVTDENIINNIADFIKEVKQYLENKLQSTYIPQKEGKFSKEALDLVNMLLAKRNGSYARIGIFRRPDEPGPLSNISLLQEGKSHIQHILYKQLSFTTKHIHDFGYTISEESKNSVNGFVQMINDKLRSNIDPVVYGMRTYFATLVNETNKKAGYFIDSSDFAPARWTEQENIFNDVHSVTTCLQNLLQDRKLTKIDGLAKKMNSSSCLTLKLYAGNVKEISNQLTYLQFLQTVSDKALAVPQLDTLFDTIETFFSESKKIERYIQDKAEEKKQEISGYRMYYLAEKEIEISIGTEMNAVDIENSTSALSNFKSRIVKIVSYRKCFEFLKALKGEKTVSWTPEWVPSFDGLIKHISKSEKWYTFLKNFYVKFSEFEIQEAMKKKVEIPINEKNLGKFLKQINLYDVLESGYVKQMESSDEHIKEINHAVELTLDARVSVHCSPNNHMVIMGNFVRVSDIITSHGEIKHLCGEGTSLRSVHIFALNAIFIDRDINAIGNKFQLSMIAPKWKIVGARLINLNGSPGANTSSVSKAANGTYPSGKGSDGTPGPPGGPAGTFLGIANHITNAHYLTITANGGAGGPGQEGGDGARGDDGADATEEDYASSRFMYSRVTPLFAYNQWTGRYMHYGFAGGKGGDGGAGGTGGLGGMHGQVKVFTLGESATKPTIQYFQGSHGLPGKGGRGGEGGKQGNHVIAKWCTRWLFHMPVLGDHWCGIEETIRQSNFSSSGSHGKDGDKGVRSESAIPFQNTALILNDYKSYLRENLIDRFKSHTLLGFLIKIEEMKDVYTPLELVNDFRNMERQILHLHNLKKDVIIFLYQNLLSRTIEYAKVHKDEKDSNLSKKVLSRLYTATLSRMYNLRVASSPSLIVDVEITIDLIKQDIDGLRVINAKNNKAGLIDRYKEKFRREIDGKISEAESLIATQIQPMIRDGNIQLEEKMLQLMNETISLQEQGSAHKQRLLQKKSELRDLLVKSYVSRIFSFTGKVISCFGPLGSVLVLLIETACQVDDSLATNAQIGTFEIPDGVLSKVQSIKSEITQLEGKTTPDMNETPGTSYGIKVEKFGKAAADIYTKYQTEKKGIDAVDDAIAQAELHIHKLEQYQLHIRNTIMPVLKNMGNDIENIAHHLKTKSQVSLAVTKWQVQRYLKDMRLQMRHFTRGFKAEDDLATCYQNLDEILTTLINIYDYIEQYEYQKQLADYIADVNTPLYNDPGISYEMKRALRDLDEITIFNLVQGRYKIAVDALKQHTFPFVHLYLQETMLPIYLESEDTFQDLVDRAGNQIDVFKSKIKEYKGTTHRQDDHTICGWFTNDYKSGKPFFVWKNETHSDTISKLLLGQKIVVTSDILTSHLDKDAVKFNSIGVNFYPLDHSLSSNLRKQLQGLSVNMTHLGNSYYRLDQKIYVMSSARQNIQRSFEVDIYGKPVMRNRVYDKIKSGDLTLSPYAAWEIQLSSSNGDIATHLGRYQNNVHLELVGQGCYLARGFNISNLNVEKYYKEDNVLSAISFTNHLDSPTDRDK